MKRKYDSSAATNSTISATHEGREAGPRAPPDFMVTIKWATSGEICMALRIWDGSCVKDVLTQMSIWLHCPPTQLQFVKEGEVLQHDTLVEEGDELLLVRLTSPPQDDHRIDD